MLSGDNLSPVKEVQPTAAVYAIPTAADEDDDDDDVVNAATATDDAVATAADDDDGVGPTFYIALCILFVLY